VVPIARRLTSGKSRHHSSTRLSLNHRSLGYDNIDDSYYDERQLPVGHHAMSSMTYPRHRRHSTVSFATMPPAVDPYRLPSSIHIKFRRKGSFVAGIGLDEAQSHIRLSGNDAYSFHDLHADSRRRIYLRIKVCTKGSLCHYHLKNFRLILSGLVIHPSHMKFLSTVTMAALTSKPLRGEYQEPVFTTCR